MKNKFFFIFQALIICNGYLFTNALIGPNVRNATLREYPSVVALVELDRHYTIEENVFCSGVFISKSHVLTYEQCFEHIGDRYYAIIAEHQNVYQGTQYFPEWWTTLERWSDAFAIHHLFHEYDVGLLKIRGEASDLVIPAIRTSVSPINMVAGRQAVVVGFGRTNISPYAEVQQTANVRILSNEQCTEKINRATGRDLKISRRYVCTDADPHVLLTEGDNGGPLFYQGNLIAISARTTSFGLPIDDPRRLNFHIDLDWYRNFIDVHLRY